MESQRIDTSGADRNEVKLTTFNLSPDIETDLFTRVRARMEQNLVNREKYLWLSQAGGYAGLLTNFLLSTVISGVLYILLGLLTRRPPGGSSGPASPGANST